MARSKTETESEQEKPGTAAQEKSAFAASVAPVAPDAPAAPDYKAMWATLRQRPQIGSVWKRISGTVGGLDRTAILAVSVHGNYDDPEASWTACVASAHGGMSSFSIPDKRSSPVGNGEWVPDDWCLVHNGRCWAPPE